MVGIRFGGGRDELLTFMQYLGVITPPYFDKVPGVSQVFVTKYNFNNTGYWDRHGITFKVSKMVSPGLF